MKKIITLSLTMAVAGAMGATIATLDKPCNNCEECSAIVEQSIVKRDLLMGDGFAVLHKDGKFNVVPKKPVNIKLINDINSNAPQGVVNNQNYVDNTNTAQNGVVQNANATNNGNYVNSNYANNGINNANFSNNGAYANNNYANNVNYANNNGYGRTTIDSMVKTNNIDTYRNNTNNVYNSTNNSGINTQNGGISSNYVSNNGTRNVGTNTTNTQNSNTNRTTNTNQNTQTNSSSNLNNTSKTTTPPPSTNTNSTNNSKSTTTSVLDSSTKQSSTKTNELTNPAKATVDENSSIQSLQSQLKAQKDEFNTRIQNINNILNNYENKTIELTDEQAIRMNDYLNLIEKLSFKLIRSHSLIAWDLDMFWNGTTFSDNDTTSAHYLEIKNQLGSRIICFDCLNEALDQVAAILKDNLSNSRNTETKSLDTTNLKTSNTAKTNNNSVM